MDLTLETYRAANGHHPFEDWHGSLKDGEARRRILIRLNRLAMGNPGDHKSVGGGVEELRFHFGPGYRVYYANIGNRLILLLAGGNKSSQDSDVRQAKNYLADYLERRQ